MTDSFSQFSNNKVIRLYDGVAPGSENWNWKESKLDKQFTKSVYNVTVPTLTVFEADKSIATGTAVVVCPGGAFHSLEMKSEGLQIAKWLNSKGVTAFILKYRLIRTVTKNPRKEWLAKIKSGSFYKEIESYIEMGITDGKTAVAYIRDNASTWGINPNKIGIMGFSAGGTLAAGVALKYDTLSRPDFVASIYPYFGGFDDVHVSSDAPPMFIAAASDDGFEFNKESISLYNKWINSSQSVELHIYRKGKHGFALNKQNIPTDGWIDLFYSWLVNLEQ